jgi:hypothetical protein
VDDRRVTRHRRAGAAPERDPAPVVSALPRVAEVLPLLDCTGCPAPTWCRHCRSCWARRRGCRPG